MIEYAVMPLADYKNTCDAIREKANSSDLIKSSDLPAKITDVYNAGRDSAVDTSKIIEATATGTRYVDIYDVSEIPHDITMQLSSDTITDFSTVKVKQFNTNLFYDLGKRTVKDVPYQNETLRQWDGKSIVLGLAYANGTYEAAIKDFSIDEENNSITFTATSTAYGVAVDIPCVPDEEQIYVWESDASFRLIILCYDEIGNVLYRNVSILNKGGSFIPPDNAKWSVLSFAPTDAYVNTPITIKNVRSYFKKLEGNGCTLPYEPYTEYEYTPNEDGIITGIKSVTPDMIFIPNKECSLTVSYHKSWILDKWNKDMWGKFQQDGKRTSYSMAFNITSGYTDKFFNPIYPIKGNCDQAFAYNADLTIIKVPCVPTSANYMFNYASRLKTIKSFDISAITGTLTQTFNNCTSLKNLTTVGTINASGFDVSTCTKLSHDSLMSVINALKNHYTPIITNASLDFSSRPYGPQNLGKGTLEVGQKYKVKYTSDYFNTDIEQVYTAKTIDLAGYATFTGVEIITDTHTAYVCSNSTNMYFYSPELDGSGGGKITVSVSNAPSQTYTATLGSTNLAKLTDAEKSIATEKGWTLA